MPLIIEVRVVPGAGRHRWLLDKSGRLKCQLKNQAERGRANEELIKSIASALKVPHIDVEIISGAISRTKRVRIQTSIDFNEFLACVGIEQQYSLL